MVKNNGPFKLTDDEKRERMVAVAEMYYGERQLTEKEIADELKLSPNTVSRILKNAIKSNVIDIRVNKASIEQTRVDLIQEFALQDARVSPYVVNTDATRRLIALEAAKYFDEVIKDHRRIGISGGRTLHEMVENIPRRPRNIAIYPLTGLWRDLRINFVDSGALVHDLWMKCEESAEGFWFPMEPISPGTAARAVRRKRRSYMQNSDIAEAYANASAVDLAFIGIAPLRPESTTIRQLENIGITYDHLNKKKAVGVAGGVWFNKAAKAVLSDYFLSVPLSAFQQMVKEGNKKAVVVAGGDEKLEAIRVFLDKKVCNVLITDGRTARSLLDKPNVINPVSAPTP